MEKIRLKIRPKIFSISEPHIQGQASPLLPSARKPLLQSLASAFVMLTLLSACASRFLQIEGSEKILKNEEFEAAIQVKEVATPTPLPEGVTPTPTPRPTATPKPKPTPRIKGKVAGSGAVPTAQVPTRRQPEFEDDEGFDGRRPKVDPYRAGEEVKLNISYFAVDAGELVLKTMPMVEVNGKSAYRFRAIAKTISVFEMFYKVDDYAEVFMDYETLEPLSYVLSVKESKLLRDARAVHDKQKGRVFFWDKKIKPDKSVEEKKQDWELPPYAQNIFSALWYIRSFQLSVGKKFKMHLTHENENLIVEFAVLRKEKISTKAGPLETFVVRPTATKNGEPKNIGDSQFWLTADDRKFLVRIESKIKIGTIVGSLESIKP
jgi:hypothetical protein